MEETWKSLLCYFTYPIWIFGGLFLGFWNFSWQSEMPGSAWQRSGVQVWQSTTPFLKSCLPDLLCGLCSVQPLTLSSFQLFSQHLTQAVFSVGVVIVISHCLMKRDKEIKNTPNRFIFYTAHGLLMTFTIIFERQTTVQSPQ